MTETETGSQRYLLFHFEPRGATAVLVRSLDGVPEGDLTEGVPLREGTLVLTHVVQERDVGNMMASVVAHVEE